MSEPRVPNSQRSAARPTFRLFLPGRMASEAYPPVVAPQGRAKRETTSFNEERFIIKDYNDRYIELQFEEIRLQDYRSGRLEVQLREMETTAQFQATNRLSADSLARSRDLRSPTITTRLAMGALQVGLVGTPTLNLTMQSVAGLADLAPGAAYGLQPGQSALAHAAAQAAARNQQRVRLLVAQGPLAPAALTESLLAVSGLQPEETPRDLREVDGLLGLFDPPGPQPSPF